MNQLPLRPNVCLLIVNQEGKLFLGERVDEANHWQFPQGGVKKGDSLEETALQEAHEELGLPRSCFSILRQLKATYAYEWETPPSYGKAKWRGQSQTFWLLEFHGAANDVCLEKSDKEFQAYQWCTLEEVRKRAHPLRQKAYKEALIELETLKNTKILR